MDANPLVQLHGSETALLIQETGIIEHSKSSESLRVQQVQRKHQGVWWLKKRQVRGQVYRHESGPKCCVVSLDANLELCKKPRTRARGWAREVQGKGSRTQELGRTLVTEMRTPIRMVLPRQSPSRGRTQREAVLRKGNPGLTQAREKLLWGATSYFATL